MHVESRSMSDLRDTGIHKESAAQSLPYSWKQKERTKSKLWDYWLLLSFLQPGVAGDANNTWKSPCFHRWSCFLSWWSSQEYLVFGRTALEFETTEMIIWLCWTEKTPKKKEDKKVASSFRVETKCASPLQEITKWKSRLWDINNKRKHEWGHK